MADSTSRTYSRPDASGVQHMFACRVVVGEYCRGAQNALTPEVRHPRRRRRPPLRRMPRVTCMPCTPRRRRSLPPECWGCVICVSCTAHRATYATVSLMPRVPQVRNPATSELYDSTVDDVSGPSIFVTYHDAQPYAEYLIRFR